MSESSRQGLSTNTYFARFYHDPFQTHRTFVVRFHQNSWGNIRSRLPGARCISLELNTKASDILSMERVIGLAHLPNECSGTDRITLGPSMLRAWMSFDLMLRCWVPGTGSHCCCCWWCKSFGHCLVSIILLLPFLHCITFHFTWFYFMSFIFVVIFTCSLYWGPTLVFFLCCSCFWCHSRLSTRIWRAWWSVR